MNTDVYSRIIAESALLGANVTVWQFATICDEAVLDDGVVVGSNVWIGKKAIIGARTRIQHGAFLPNGTVVGQDVFIGPNVTMTDDKYPKAGLPYQAAPPILEDGCSIGAGAVLLPGVRIGRSAMVGAGAVITEDVPDGATYVGCPARPL
jgi:acetyltransferase-like isoleucine patch superfamily enzyme